MEIPPKKPHFFKPILPGFKNGLKIPIGFLKYLKGHDHIEHVVLKRAGNKWLVKMNGRRLEDGWEKFAEEHDLQLGDMLIFRHEGDMDFDVSIFDSTHCDTEYAEYMQIQKEKEKEIKTSGKAFSNVEATMDMHLSRSQFICTIKPYSLSKYFLCIPKRFAQENRLIDRKCNIIMSDKQRSWTFSVYTSGEITYFGRGWHEFCITNCLKEGDRLMFEMISNGETPRLRFHDLRGSPSLQAEVKMKKLDAERMSDKGLRLKISSTPTPESQVAASEHAYSRITSGCFNIC
ncbi:hypothetical protein CQW23_30563 [Capsicum baccatum]|uniref:TF-B3 domain-containing protein n=1 Tax=Capsicum baccatum TaxID=33114 RepID=A0A2G2VA20_CAPBA|nr:hypothetical protein CQW23_30563 [Capsicum baccatum]